MKLSIKNKKIGYKNKHNTRKKNKKIFKMVGGQIEDIKKDEEYTMKDLKKMEDYLKNTINIFYLDSLLYILNFLIYYLLNKFLCKNRHIYIYL